MDITSQGRPSDRLEREVDLAAWSDCTERPPSRPRREAGPRRPAAPPDSDPPLDPADGGESLLVDLTRGTSPLYLEFFSLSQLGI